jgi:quinol monooxygenase YgiN
MEDWMNIFRIGEFRAHPGDGDALLNLLNKYFVPMIEESDGLLAYQVFQRQDEPEKVMIIEHWASLEAHQASAQDIPAEALGKVRELLAEAPAGGYYVLVKANQSPGSGE